MKNLFILLMLSVWFPGTANGGCLTDLAWDNISGEIMEVNAVWVDGQEPDIIMVGAGRGVFMTEDAGRSWQAMLFGGNKMVNFLYVDQKNRDSIYAGCSSGLFFSRNRGKNWMRIYQGDSEPRSNCLSLIKSGNKKLYLGTEAGLLVSQDNGNIWRRFPGELGNLPVRAIAADEVNNQVYLAADEAAYRLTQDGRVKRIFVSSAIDSQDTDEQDNFKINHLCLDLNNPQVIYLATTQGIFTSQNQGRTWQRFTDSGLLSRRVSFISLSADSVLWAITNRGVFAYIKDRWRELSLRLAVQDIRFLSVDNRENIYVGTDKGLFRSRIRPKAIHYPEIINQEPSIEQVQQAAIKYAGIVDPQQIASHRKLARLQALLPEFSLDYDKTISTYNNSNTSRFTVGPLDWGVSLKWKLGDLIWSEQQRLIDSQTRLVISLRQDILDEVIRLYFERKRVQSELISSQNLDSNQIHSKELKLEELTAMLDGLTGGYFSKFDLTE